MSPLTDRHAFSVEMEASPRPDLSAGTTDLSPAKSTCAKFNGILAIDPGGIGIGLSICRLIVEAEAGGCELPCDTAARLQSTRPSSGREFS